MASRLLVPIRRTWIPTGAMLAGVLAAGCGELPVSASVEPTLVAGQGWSDTLRIGELRHVSVDVRDSDGRTLSGVDVTWSSSDPLVVGVDPAGAGPAAGGTGGRLAGLSGGAATITAEIDHPALSGSLQLAVVVASAGWPDSVAVGEQAAISLAVPPAASVSWESQDAAVLRVAGEGPSGELTGRSAGQGLVIARVTEAEFPDVTFRVPVRVTPIRIVRTGIWPDTVNVTNNFRVSVVLEGTLDRLRDVPAQWTSSNEAVLSIVGQGRSIDGDTIYAEVSANSTGGGEVVLAVGGEGSDLQSLRHSVLVAKKWVSVSAGYEQTCAIDIDRQLYCWGGNRWGEVGDGTYDLRSRPVRVATTLAYDEVIAGGGPSPASSSGGGLGPVVESHTCARADRRIDCWGSYWSGQLGARFRCPVQGYFFTEQCTWPRPAEFVGDTLNPSLADAAAFALGTSFTCTSTVSLSSGDLGFTDANCFGSIYDSWDRGGYGFEQGMAGSGFHCATPNSTIIDGLFVSAKIYCSGLNELGQVGDGSLTTTDSLAPVLAAGGNSGIIPRGFPSPGYLDAGAFHACAVGTGFDTGERALWCWGSNSFGQLGPSATTQACPGGPCSPVAVAVPLEMAIGDVRRVALGGAFSCVLTVSGELSCWGDNGSGQLADGQTASRSTPERAAEGLLFSRVDGGDRHMCGVDVNGTLFCWGENGQGQLGVGDTSDRSRPVRVLDPIR